MLELAMELSTVLEGDLYGPGVPYAWFNPSVNGLTC